MLGQIQYSNPGGEVIVDLQIINFLKTEMSWDKELEKVKDTTRRFLIEVKDRQEMIVYKKCI